MRMSQWMHIVFIVSMLIAQHLAFSHLHPSVQSSRACHLCHTADHFEQAAFEVAPLLIAPYETLEHVEISCDGISKETLLLACDGEGEGFSPIFFTYALPLQKGFFTTAPPLHA